MAEKKAWEFVKEHKNIELSVINPGFKNNIQKTLISQINNILKGFIIGPVLTDVVAASMEFPKRLLENGIPMLPDVSLIYK